ncbi:Mu transposase C-terminal domain-containing protein [Rhizobium sp. BR 249]|uniref:Mu transposase C-terminal domain-containing protein n=1 Tax=Rhizobium sp. BR 249 TaxID=3040011 RepID=UPI0039BF3B93
MTMASAHFDFLRSKASPILSAEDLAIPATPPDQFKCQAPDIRPGHLFVVHGLNGERSFYAARHWTNSAPNMPKCLYLEHAQLGAPLILSAWQIAWLSREGRLSGMPGPEGIPYIEGMALSLTEAQKATARRYLEYVRHYRKLCEELNGGRDSDRIGAQARREVAQRRMETPISRSTFYEAKRKLAQNPNIDPLVALAPKLNPGNQTRRLPEPLLEAIQIAVKDSWSDPEGTAITVRDRVAELTAVGADYSPWAEAAAKVSMRTFQRHRKIDGYTRTFLRHGEEEAERITAPKLRILRPLRPLEVVDIDYVSLNVVVLDDEVSVAYGRPELLVFRDRHSGTVVGFDLSFESPSFAGFIRGLRHAIYPKDPHTLPDGVSWPWYGLMARLGVDNASMFIGGDMEAAAREMGFQLVEYRPGRPYEKGALEHLFAVMNMQLIDRLEGATAGSPEERKKFDKDRNKAVPTITLRELRGFLTYYFAEVYNRSLKAGIGPLITLKDVPARLWEVGIEAAPVLPPLDPNIFVRQASYTEQVTIQRDGIRLDYLHYQSAELLALTLHPNHKRGTREHSATKYEASRDPNDLKRLFVRDPYRNVVIEVPIIDIEKRYATGLTLFQHTKIVAYHNEEIGKIGKVEDLVQARAALEVKLNEAHQRRKRHDTARKLARFLSRADQKMRRSEVVELAADQGAADYIDYTNPVAAEPLEKKSSRASASSPVASTANRDSEAPPVSNPPPEPVSPAAAKPDIQNDSSVDDLRDRHQGWDD